MIRNSKQNWTIGSTVKVGFLTLKVVAAIKTPGDNLPDAYFLTDVGGTKIYRFVPHNGLTLTTLEEAQTEISTFRQFCERIAAEETQKAILRARISAKFNEIFA